MFNHRIAAVLAAFAFFGAGCNQLSNDVSAMIPGGKVPPGTQSTNKLGGSCEGDSSKLCLGLKYVVYEHRDGTPVVSEATVAANIKQINAVWAACGIAFQIDEYKVVNPQDYGLSFGSAAVNELDEIRRAFNDGNTLLVVTTENWGTTKNAWTQPPGAGIYGVVLEGAVGDYPNIIAHELGHYLSLDHVGDTANVMSAIIYTSSTGLSSSQCSASRDTTLQYWAAMLR